MAVQWTNPVPNLWYTNSPTPGYITYDANLNQYRLCMSNMPGNYLYAASNLAAAQTEYEKEATQLLITNPVLLQPALMEIATPADGQIVAFAATDGSFGSGTYSLANSNIIVSAQVVDAGNVHSWSPLPTGGIMPPRAPIQPSPGIRVNYTVDEQFTGLFWIDGKKIYQKTIDLGVWTGQQTLIAHNIINIDMVIDYYGAAEDPNSVWFCLPFQEGEITNDAVAIFIEGINIRLITNRSPNTDIRAFLTLLYTCSDR